MSAFVMSSHNCGEMLCDAASVSAERLTLKVYGGQTEPPYRNILKSKTAGFLASYFCLFHTFFFLFTNSVTFLNCSGRQSSQGVFYTSINFLFCEIILRKCKGNPFLLAYSNLKANDEWLAGRARLPRQGK